MVDTVAVYLIDTEDGVTVIDAVSPGTGANCSPNSTRWVARSTTYADWS